MPKLEEAKRLHKEACDTKELLRSFRTDVGAVLQGDGQYTRIATILESVDRELNEVANLMAQVVGQEVMK